MTVVQNAEVIVVVVLFFLLREEEEKFRGNSGGHANFGAKDSQTKSERIEPKLCPQPQLTWLEIRAIFLTFWNPSRPSPLP